MNIEKHSLKKGPRDRNFFSLFSIEEENLWRYILSTWKRQMFFFFFSFFCRGAKGRIFFLFVFTPSAPLFPFYRSIYLSFYLTFDSSKLLSLDLTTGKRSEGIFFPQLTFQGKTFLRGAIVFLFLCFSWLSFLILNSNLASRRRIWKGWQLLGRFFYLF